MRHVENRVQILEKWIVDYFQFYTKMVAQSMQNASTLQLRRIRHYLVIIVFTDFLINVIFIELLALFAFNEQ